MFFEKRRPKPLLTLNIVALIDICSLILIFLVMESFFGESSVFIPSKMTIPHSVSKESVDNAPQVMIFDGAVQAAFINQSMPLESFHQETPDSSLAAFKEKIKDYVSLLPPKSRESGVLLNIVADQNTPYRDIFDVVAVFRELGFQSVLFIAQAGK